MVYSRSISTNQKGGWMVRGVAIVILLVFFVLLPYLYWQYLNSPVDENGETQAFVIQKDETTDSIASRLKEAGLIRSPLAFKWHLRSSGMAGQLQAGDFKLSPAMTLDELVATMSEGSIDKWVTFLEGWRNEQMALELEKELGISSEEFLAAAEGKEGYLFPDTYLINKDATAADAVAILENTFNQKYDDKLVEQIKAQGLTPEQGVILASMVEREGRSDKVRTEIAGILLKRLKMGMKLDIDATVQYAKDSQQIANFNQTQLKSFKFWQPITVADYKNVVSPFNTYLNNGLPPSPIANPSLSSLEAVANADPNTPYVFYYHDPEGNSHYAKTLEEHNANVANHR